MSARHLRGIALVAGPEAVVSSTATKPKPVASTTSAVLTTARAYTVAEIAARWGVKPHLILALIRNGELRAIDLRAKLAQSKKPRWKILTTDLSAFETARAGKPQVTPFRRRKPPAAQTEPIGRRW